MISWAGPEAWRCTSPACLLQKNPLHPFTRMAFSFDQNPELVAFPKVLRDLLAAELAAGNEVVEVDHGFPAPPIGANLRLAKAVTTRPRTSSHGLRFRESQGSLYGGLFTDAAGVFFLLEPALPPPPEPDMDAIRAAHTPSPQRAAQRQAEQDTTKDQPLTALQQFERSMVIDYEKWHDGIGYDLQALSTLSPEERNLVEQRLLSQGVRDWRDVEVLAQINSPSTRSALRSILQSSNAELRGAVMRFAPALISRDERTEVLLKGLKDATLFGGLSQMLDQVEDFHPPVILAQLFRGTLQREGEVAVHFAAMLCFLHGKAKERFAWSKRPFYLRFNTSSRSEREAAFRDLCTLVNVDAATYLNERSGT